MSSVGLNPRELFKSYKTWVCQNPETTGEFESLVKWASYFVAGRINNSNILTELIYSLSNLLVLFNDQLIHSSKPVTHSSRASEQLKVSLTVLEYSEVFVEISAKKLWGESGKWIIIAIIQLLKCVGRLVLLFHHKTNLLHCPPIEPLKRSQVTKSYQDAVNRAKDEAINRMNSVAFTLKSSGKVIRRVNAAPSVNSRTWKPPSLDTHNNSEKDVVLTGDLLKAEALYIMKPIAHLIALHFGKESWKPWLVSFAMDITSLYLLHKSQRDPSQRLQMLSKRQRVEVSHRCFALLLYLLRSPCYDRYSKNKINAFLDSLAKYLPLAHYVCNPVKQYIPYWQGTYFYMWSS